MRRVRVRWWKSCNILHGKWGRMSNEKNGGRRVMRFLANILASGGFDCLAIYQRDTALASLESTKAELLAARMKNERLESVVWFAQEEVRRLEGDLEAATARAIEEYHAGIRNNTPRAERSGLSGNNKSPLARASVSKVEPGAGVARVDNFKKGVV